MRRAARERLYWLSDWLSVRSWLTSSSRRTIGDRNWASVADRPSGCVHHRPGLDGRSLLSSLLTLAVVSRGITHARSNHVPPARVGRQHLSGDDHMSVPVDSSGEIRRRYSVRMGAWSEHVGPGL